MSANLFGVGFSVLVDSDPTESCQWRLAGLSRMTARLHCAGSDHLLPGYSHRFVWTQGRTWRWVCEEQEPLSVVNPQRQQTWVMLMSSV